MNNLASLRPLNLPDQNVPFTNFSDGVVGLAKLNPISFLLKDIELLRKGHFVARISSRLIGLSSLTAFSVNFMCCSLLSYGSWLWDSSCVSCAEAIKEFQVDQNPLGFVLVRFVSPLFLLHLK